MKHIPVITALLVITFASCKKDKDPEPVSPVTTTPSAGSYSKLATGNYWIYEEFTVDTLGNATSTGRIDSCYVEKDTMISSKTYYKLIKPSSLPLYNIQFLRDSSSCIVNEQGKIFFSATDFTTHFYHVYRYDPPPANDTIYESWSQMYNETAAVTVPAGNFHVLNYKTTYRMYGSYALVAGQYRYMDSRYSENIGLIAQTLPLYAGSPYHTEMRLLRYHLN